MFGRRDRRHVTAKSKIFSNNIAMTNCVLMIRPANFGFNEETAGSNVFQQEMSGADAMAISSRAVQEFDSAVTTLRAAGVQVIVVEDSPDPVKTDAVFPNNWISTHPDGTVITWPMASSSRRQEIRADIVEELQDQFVVTDWWRLHEEAPDGQFLEGTGSLVLDHEHRLAWACHSPRTSQALVNQFCDRMGFQPVLFDATDRQGTPIYHTNVMMAVTGRLVVICLDCIADQTQRDTVVQRIQATGKSIVELTWPQIEAFAGNLLQVAGENDQPCVVMSSAARRALHPQQLRKIEEESEIIELAIPTLETCGGGSVRCLLAEIYLQSRNG